MDFTPDYSLYELREANGQGHECDFLTVGSMGHASSIALGVALNCPDKRVWCIDGDGAVLMHMGALPVIASSQPSNLIHIVINNGSHETVGGQPTVMKDLEIFQIAKTCGYPYAACARTLEELDRELKEAADRGALSFLEVKCSMGSRKDLGRPTTTAIQNKEMFVRHLKED